MIWSGVLVHLKGLAESFQSLIHSWSAAVRSTAGDDVACRLPQVQLPQIRPGAVGHRAGPPDEFDLEAARLLHGEDVRQLLAEQAGIDIGPSRAYCGEPDEMQREIAWLIQTALERALTQIVRRAVARTGIRRVCLAGGVALNCVANTMIANLPEVDELFVQPAASDVGQALGNALWAHRQEEAERRRWTMRSCSLGRPYSRTEIETALGPGTSGSWSKSPATSPTRRPG